jgi:hypothetical protein
MRIPAVICLLATVGVFVFLHTGSRASNLCARDGSVVPEGLSAWPPGARCSGGEPVRADTKFDTTVLLVVPGIALLAFGAAAIARPAGHRTPDCAHNRGSQ